MKAIINGKLIMGHEIVENKVLLYDQDIISIQENLHDMGEICVFDAQGSYVAPGFIDIHIHGAFGYDAMDWELDAIQHIREGLCQFGVTGFLPTTMSMADEHIIKALRNIRSSMAENKPGARVLGAHLEGPFISVEKKGAHEAEHIKAADYELIENHLDVIKLLTIAPEPKGNMKFIHDMRQHKHVSLSIGHSNATYEEAMEAIQAGIRSATHLCNAMSGLDHRAPGVMGAVLDSDIYCELIADQVHVHPALFRIISKAKGSDKVILITDAIRAACMKQGTYELGGQQVKVEAGSARLSDGTLAGSVLHLDQAVKNMRNQTKLPLPEIISMVTANPAKLIGLDSMIGSLQPGKRADFTIFDENINIKATIINGCLQYAQQL